MPDLEGWYRPNHTLPWVFRGESGRVWAFPNVPLAWSKKLRERLTKPEGEPMPPTYTRLVAGFLGIPGCEVASVDRYSLAMWEHVEEVRSVG